MINKILTVIFVVLFLYTASAAIGALARDAEQEREQQKQECINTGGKYAQSLKYGPSKDYCIR